MILRNKTVFVLMRDGELPFLQRFSTREAAVREGAAHRQLIETGGVDAS